MQLKTIGIDLAKNIFQVYGISGERLINSLKAFPVKGIGAGFVDSTI